MNNLNNITKESMEILKNQGAIEFVDPNETLAFDIFNKEKLDDGNPNYKYLEIDTKFIFGALHSIIFFF